MLTVQDGSKDEGAIRRTIAAAEACTDKPTPSGSRRSSATTGLFRGEGGGADAAVLCAGDPFEEFTPRRPHPWGRGVVLGGQLH